MLVFAEKMDRKTKPKTELWGSIQYGYLAEKQSVKSSELKTILKVETAFIFGEYK